MKITKRNRQTITNSCQVSECDKLKDDENISIESACDVNSGSELDYMLNGSDQYAVEQALDMLRSGDEDDIETVVRYAVNVVNNGNAEPEYEDEDFYQEEADYDTVLRAVKAKLGKSVKSATDINRADYLDDLCEAIDSYIDEQGYSSVVSVTDGYYITVQLFDFNEEDFETEDSLHTAVFDVNEIDENKEDIHSVAEDIGQSVIDEYESVDFSDDRYEEKETKQVVDSDGFMTDYTMYYDRNDDKYIFMLGDKDAYGPDDSYADWECDSEQEAYEWFDSYDGFVDEEY